MIDYTSSLAALIRDLILRVPGLSHIDETRLLVFARHGRTASAGPFATCHSLTLPTSEPGYYFWLDRSTGEMTRRSPWFVTRTPTVTVDGRSIQYLISFALPRFCDQSLDRSRKRSLYQGQPGWVAKLDTVVHELYHIDPSRCGLRSAHGADGRETARMHGCGFQHEVAAMVRAYLASPADPALVAFLQCGFPELVHRYGAVVATTFRTFPSFPQRFPVPLSVQPPVPTSAFVQPIRASGAPTAYSERDLVIREFRELRAVRPADALGQASRETRADSFTTSRATQPAAASDGSSHKTRRTPMSRPLQ